MLKDLSKIIDQVYLDKRSNKRNSKKIVFLIGNGIHAVSNIMNDECILEEAKKRNWVSQEPESKSFQEFKWRLFESARYYSANALSTFAHACIFQMVKDGVCKDVITTNYDLFFDSIWEKTPELGVVQNPVMNEHEYCWDDFYSYKKDAGKKPRYWKIHGSLSHVVFRGKKSDNYWLIQRLPRFPISTNQPDLAEAFGGSTLTPYMGYEEGIYPKSCFSPPFFLSPVFEPFIDWTYGNKRHMFQREINAVSRLLMNKRNIAAIITIGFRGYYNENNSDDPWNEELVPIINKAIEEKEIPVFMALYEGQYENRHEPTSGLMRRLISRNRCYSYKDAGDFMEKLALESSQFPYTFAEKEWRIWHRFWFLNMEEQSHA